MLKKSTTAIFLLWFIIAGSNLSAEQKKAEPVSIPGIVTVTANVRQAPPGWAVLQRHLMTTIEDAAKVYIDKYTYRGGTLTWNGKIDDDYECFTEWPVFYMIGGNEQILDWSIREFDGITRQWTYQKGKQTVEKEFVKQYDSLHLTEGYVIFQHMGLADPIIPENVDRAKRFAGFYLNEDPEAQNYDPRYKIIKSIATGSKGPAEHQDGYYTLKWEHASLYPLIKEPVNTWVESDAFKKKINDLYDKVVVRCDVPMNLTIAGLVTNAYLYTGDEKYKKWVLDYVDAWMERTRKNNGIIPDNIGRTGKIGEYRNGQWWGGFFGWSGRYSNIQLFRALITATECAHLLSGDDKYLDFLRSQIKVLYDNATIRDGNFVVPYKYGPKGWHDYRPLDAYILSHLWHESMDPEDWKLIEKLRDGVKNGPLAISVDDAPNIRYGEELWHSDGTSFDWNTVYVDIRRWQNIYNEPAYLNWLDGRFPDWPEKILQAEYEHVCLALDRMNNPNYVHDWGSQTLLERNPVLVAGLRQMTMGAPDVCFNGGLLRAQVRYFDCDRARPGLPEDVAALVKKLEKNRTVVELVNLNAFETRNLIIQGGAYGEHQFTEVRFTEKEKDSSGKESTAQKTLPVNKKFFTVKLPPSTTIELEIGVKRFANQPSFAFHGIRRCIRNNVNSRKEQPIMLRHFKSQQVLTIAATVLFSFMIAGNPLYGGQKPNEPVSIPGMVKIEASIREAPPEWALMQRHLIDAINKAAPVFQEKYSYRGGTLNRHGKIDDDYECYISWPLFYIIGGNEQILDWSITAFNAITRQWTYQQRQSVLKEMVKSYDMLHLSEGYVGFQYFGLADPDIPEHVDRSRRYAGFYMNEDPDAPNYDPKLKLIRSMATGSAGPQYTWDCWYMLVYGHASLYPIVKELEPGWDKNPKRKAEIQKLYDKVVTRGDVPMNLTVCGLVTNAYLYTGEDKYKRWVTDYVDAWMERTKQNNGIIPDNVGLSGKIGEYRKGQWWGGFFGWTGRFSIGMIYNSLITATECAYIITGDPKYLDFLRSHIDLLLTNAVTRDGNLLVPYKYGPNGWDDFRPMQEYIPSHLWHTSLDPADWERIEVFRKGTVNGPWAFAYAMSPDPPKPGEERWRPDGTLYGWNTVHTDLSGNKYTRNEAAHLTFLGGTNPEWLRNSLAADYEQVCRTVERLRGGTYEHAWESQTMLTMNPVVTNSLAQMTMGAPFTCFNGGLLMAHVRYFDPDRARPGLPPDVAALVEKLELNCITLTLVNTSALDARNVIVQAGAYGQDQFTDVTFSCESKDENSKITTMERTLPVNKHYFAVELPPSTTIEMKLGTKRCVNKPSYAFPWHGTN